MLRQDPSGLGIAPFQLIAAFCEFSALCFSHLVSFEERLSATIDAISGIVLPLLEATRAKARELRSVRVQAIFDHYHKDIAAIFRMYAAANMSAAIEDSATLGTAAAPRTQGDEGRARG